MAPPLRIYGVPFSQPVRSVIWACLLKRLPFVLVPVNPGTAGRNGSRNKEYLKVNPTGTIPFINDDGFWLGEANAILTYLSDKHGWDDLFPTDSKVRARVNWYLHSHHRGIREASLSLVAPKIRKDLTFPEAMQRINKMTFERALRALDTGWLAEADFIAGTTHPTIADLCCYMELGQLTDRYGAVWDFSRTPRVAAWAARMARVPHHDELHLVNEVIGQLRGGGPTQRRIVDANKQAIARIAQLAAKL